MSKSKKIWIVDDDKLVISNKKPDKTAIIPGIGELEYLKNYAGEYTFTPIIAYKNGKLTRVQLNKKTFKYT